VGKEKEKKKKKRKKLGGGGGGGGGGGSTQLINMSHTLYHYKIQRRNGNNKHNRENWGWL